MSKGYIVKGVMPDKRKVVIGVFSDKECAKSQARCCIECGWLRATVKKANDKKCGGRK